MDLLVRWFRPGDADDVVSLHSQSAQWFEDFPVDRDFVLSVSERSDFRLAVAEDSGRVVGYVGVLFFETVGRAEVGPISVGDGYRGRGVGASMMGFVLSFLKAHGVGRVVATVKSSNRDAFFFFMDSGFSVEALLKQYTLKKEDAIQMVLFLD
ncbi:MAG: GNAT family N-acetyltransferase [Candidatus Altiarchaeota archaeon]